MSLILHDQYRDVDMRRWNSTCYHCTRPCYISVSADNPREQHKHAKRTFREGCIVLFATNIEVWIQADKCFDRAVMLR